MKIDKLTLKNFKFFYGEKTLDFEGKNILLYGENGSGKSSIYWALYTLLNNAKSPNIKIQNYFNHREDNRLLNRYIEEAETARVSITLDNGDEYAISKDDANINQYKRGTTIKEASIASDFINYKLLAKLYDFKHSQTIDLFELFESDIFSYLTYDSYGSYHDTWKKLLASEKQAPIVNTWSYFYFGKAIEAFNEKLERFLDSIIQSTNEILKEHFYPHIKVKFTYRPLEYDSRPRLRKYRKLIYPKINITIDLLNENIPIESNRKINQPHTFLNEAKLTAIALSIRLSILRTRLSTNGLKILVLDDLLISLDMSNRDIVVNMLINDSYLQDYQIIILTHDRAFYERTKEIFDYYKKDEWKYFEMYQDLIARASKLQFSISLSKNLLAERSAISQLGYIEVPYIKIDSTYSARAKQYYADRDFPAAANYLRKEVERLYHKNLSLGKLESIVELSRKVINYGELEKCFPPLITALKSFENCSGIHESIRAQKCIEFSKIIQKALDKVYAIIGSDKFFDIGLMKDHILNPQSHDDFTKPLYKKELEDAFKGIKELQKAVEKNILNRMTKKREEVRKKNTVSKYRRRNK